MRRLEKTGPAQLRLHAQFAPAEVDELVRRAFEIEDRSRKSGAGETVLYLISDDNFAALQRTILLKFVLAR